MSAGNPSALASKPSLHPAASNPQPVLLQQTIGERVVIAVLRP
jgi:hypothetical protein